ncbi:hypothetical protein COLO4_06607 [Corchorus olitorius]|uniref:Uncharacterized protein n=1 Tax=Corchorus olitorius TaxID=93759 RepID=A0A1R3KML8_9ROSI|nr:hypothetical protein COLO4_06607 [Corchorus olitorius]
MEGTPILPTPTLEHPSSSQSDPLLLQESHSIPEDVDRVSTQRERRAQSPDIENNYGVARPTPTQSAHERLPIREGPLMNPP